VQVHEVMSRSVEVVGPDATLEEAARRMRERNVGLLPVCDGDRLLGMITDRDIAVRGIAEGKDPRTTPVREAMTPEVIWVFEDADLHDAAQLMEENEVRRVVVLNHDKRLVGVVSLDDVAARAGEQRLAGEVLQQVAPPSETQS
jgi:CBS domain-containing protein